MNDVTQSPATRRQPDEPSEGALLALYEQTWEEIARLREYQWRIAYGLLTLSAGLIAAINIPAIRELLTPPLRLILTTAQASAAALAVYYLVQVHVFLTQQRNVRRRIEEQLHLYDAGVEGAGPVLPTSWKGRRISFTFQAGGLLLPLMIAVLLVQALSVYLVWVL